MARGLVPRPEVVELRLVDVADASWKRGQRGWKRQPLGGLIGLGTSPSSTIALALRARARVRDRHRREQRAGVRVPRLRVELVRGRDLRDLAEVHHEHAVRDVPDDVEVVRDEHVGEPEVALEVLEQVQDLGLHRDVERRDGLVADDQLRVHGERAGDADALALAARELVREAVVVLGVQADDVEQLLHAPLVLRRRCRSCGPRAARPTMKPTRLRGFSDAYGSWKIIIISRRTGRISVRSDA